jgi:glutamate synthase (NADPH/NADH) large chain
MKAGLYQPDEFKDNCGFGLIAHMQGEPSHTLLQTAIEALTCMTHRGGINADGKTGDGCGLLIQKPDRSCAPSPRKLRVELPKQYAVGMVFFNQDPVKAEAARENMNREILLPACSWSAGAKCRSTPASSAAWPLSACRRSSRCSSAVKA